ncbi:Ig-like domain-containing protein [uncultured Psychrobacter sp.]|uniref:Ig-like domain-containing protein n=1 Tax=uncultured Psychrobacter sp. TaxID=259303 RepID=UPI002607DB6E|nr:Ig-like domain-containing protein [uncultured Psychrobacter sp.]
MSHTSLPTFKLFQLTALTLSLALAGCGGGGTDTVAPEPDTGVQQPGTGGNNGGGTEQPVGSLNISSSQLVDVDDNPITSIGLEGAYYEVTVTDSNGQPLANAKVAFSIDAPGVDLSQTTSGSTLTNSDGEARIFLKPNAPEVSGAYVITANVSNNDNTAINNLTFAVQATNVNLSGLTAVDSQLSAGGQTSISLTATDTEGVAISGILVNLNASCGQLPTQATSDENGVVTFVYKAIKTDNTLCSGPVRVTASTSSSATQTANLTVQAPEANSIVFTSDSFRLGAKNSGSSATGIVEFTVYSNNKPLANQAVTLNLKKAPFDLTFGVLNNREDIRLTTDASGKVSVQIYPGTTPGPVEIKATLVSDSNINALSKGIFIDSSRVTQDGLSLSTGKNVLDWGFDGDSTSVTARLVDRNGNKVPDDTVVSFTAEGGKIFPSSCETVDGECEVTFSTQNPRPGDGRATILAVAEGEKAYIDKNENNAWDEGIDTLVHNIGDTFRDDNENGTFEIGEFTYPLTTKATDVCENNIKEFIQLKFPSSIDEVKEAFERNFISDFVSPNKPMTCNSGLSTVVRHESIQLLSNSGDSRFTLVDNLGMALSSQNVSAGNSIVRVRINSGGFYDLNPMPSGTTISGTVVDKTNGTNSGSCEIDLVGGADKVPDLVATGAPGENTGTINTYALNQCEAGDYFKISVTSPRNNTSTLTYIIQ